MTTKLILTLLLATSAMAAPALPPPPPPHSWGFGHGPMIQHELGLTSDQKQQLESLRAEIDAVAGPLLERLSELNARLRQLLDAEEPDATEVGQQMLAIRRIERQLEQAWKDHTARFETILTPEQRERLKELPGPGRPPALFGRAGGHPGPASEAPPRQ